MQKQKAIRAITLRASLIISAAIFACSPLRAEQPPQFAKQGLEWELWRNWFYTADQGSRMIPYAWMKALQLPDGRGFLDDGLARYGYLPNPDADPADLPIGFLSTGKNPIAGEQTVGMTCAACHTRQIEVNGAAWRIDGGPALVNVQGLFGDIASAMGTALSSDAAFAKFAERAQKFGSPETNVAELRKKVEAWYNPYKLIMKNSLPTPPEHRVWGWGRLDAVSMIFNRVSGLDVGPSADHIIESNMRIADAPTRYPFVWNAARQDMTQWPGFAKNGDDVTGLARNVGEVLGVFALFHPQKTASGGRPEYLAGASINFPGLLGLEWAIKKIDPPRWPDQWPHDAALARKGEKIFNTTCATVGCHKEMRGERRLSLQSTWKTPIVPAGTDIKEITILGRVGDSGVLAGELNLLTGERLKQTCEPIISIVATAVSQSILEEPVERLMEIESRAVANLGHNLKAPQFLRAIAKTEADKILQGRLAGFYDKSKVELSPQQTCVSPPADPNQKFPYEARVLHGIWATAPYLHNGSVRSLADLLKPAAERDASFQVGPAYDIENLGLAKDQPKTNYTFHATDCAQIASGDSNCGHEFGASGPTKLTEDQKKALLEYLKTY